MLAILMCVMAAPSPSSGEDHAAAPSTNDQPARTNLRNVFGDSLRLLILEHSTRIAVQQKTRRELGGSFLGDYRRSLQAPRGWSDGDGWLVNYIGHPGHGAAAGFIWAHHDPESGEGRGFRKDYWIGRLRATAWTAAYSLQFEIGPLSEASIGNVGKDPRTVGWVDHVVTPVGGFAVMVAEDALDRYVIERVERRLPHPMVRALLRTTLNPSRAIANVAGGRAPWTRQSRALSMRGPQERRD